MNTPHSHSPQAGTEYGHLHPHAPEARGRKLLVAFAITSVMMLVEAGGGFWSGSLALIADAGHMLVDALALLLAWLGAWLARRPADARRSYGYGRMEVLAGFVNALSQIVLVGWIVYEGVHRLLHPGAILSGIMLAVAVAGLVVNGLVLRMLHGHARDDVNLAGASLHVLGDLLGSVAAVAAALAIRAFGWLWADPLLSLLVAALLLNSAWRLLRRSAHILLEGVPEGLDGTHVREVLMARLPVLADVHHVHVWQLASGSRMATLHARVGEGEGQAGLIHAIGACLEREFDIGHVTVQIEAGDCAGEPEDCAGHERH